MRKFLFSFFVVALTLVLFSRQGVAAVFSGQVLDESKAAVAQVQVVIPSLQKGTVTDTSGNFKVENIPVGNYTIEFRRLGYATQARQFEVFEGNPTPASIELKASSLAANPITITASSEARDVLTTPASVTVMEGRSLDQNRGQSAMSAIQNSQGANIVSQGPGVAKPVIRGMSAQDVVVVEDGIRNEVFQWGREHAPEIDPLSADRVEILRGADSLMYGSDALGGVISVTKPELPSSALGADPLSGKVVVNGNSVNNNLGQGVVLSGAEGDWGYRGTVSQQKAGDFRTPAGIVPNTGLQEASGDMTLGVRKEWGTLSANYGRLSKQLQFQDDSGQDTEYQNLAHEKGYVRANIPTGLFRYDINYGYDHADRKEFDSNGNPDPANGLFGGSDPVLRWKQWTNTVDIKAHHGAVGPFNGTLGLSALNRDEQSVGENHLTPSYKENGGGIYAVENATFGKFNFSGGVRGDHSKYDISQDDLVGQGTDNPIPVQAQTLTYSALTGALGAVWHLFEPFAVAANVGRGFRNPTPFDLFADGVHEGTGHVEIGNKDLKNETSLNSEVSLRFTSNRFRADWGFFRNKIDNFIFSAPTGNTDVSSDDPIYQVTQGDAIFRGTDMTLAAEIIDWLSLTGGFDVVRGQNKTLDAPLPAIPADRLKAGFRVHTTSLGALKNPYFGSDAQFVTQQNRIADFETRTAGYTLVGLKIGAEIPVLGNRIAFDAGVDNLTNKAYFDHLSLYKTEGILEPGRNYFLRMSASFGNF